MGMNKYLPEFLSMLKNAEVEIKKEYQVLMVNKTTSFKNNGKKGKPKSNFKKDGKFVVATEKKAKAVPELDTECFYCKGTGHRRCNFPKYMDDKKNGKGPRNKRQLAKDEVTMRVGNGSKVDVIIVGT
ncbi:uncharacterized protein [Lolium perenne]|uniref:uncharacterized protein n=1 Tax=Lolium perenne TaxID=4522 RepID=UPI003A99929C